jgi:hypothetical protein
MPKIWGYYDESGEYDHSGTLLNMTIGGVFAPLEQWRSFDVRWRATLASEGLDWFHMTEFEKWKPPFDFKHSDGSRDKLKHERLLNALLDIMLDHIDGFYGFGAVSMFDPGSPALNHANLMEDCVAAAIKNAVLDVYDFYKQPLWLVFGKQKHFGEKHIRQYVETYDVPRGKIKCLSMENPKDVRPLQAADVLAYEMARAQRSGRNERYPFRKLKSGAQVRNLQMNITWTVKSWRL